MNEKQLQDISEDVAKFYRHFNDTIVNELKPWQEFFGACKMPSLDKKNIEQRIITNWDYYRCNYLCVVAIVVGLQIIFAPIVFLVLVICSSVCVYALLIHKRPLEFGNTEITYTMKVYGCCAFSFLAMALSGVMDKLLWVTLYSIVLCFIHMLLRPRSVSSKTEKIYEEMKPTGSMWLDPENPNATTDGSKRKQVGGNSFLPFGLPTSGKRD